MSYQVRAHFVWNLNRPEFEQDRNENKYHNMAKRMIERGGRRDIFLGTRECQGYVEPCEFGEGAGYYDETPFSPSKEIAFGFMYHGITYADEAELEEDRGRMTVRFWRPVMRNGYVLFCPPEECPEKRHCTRCRSNGFRKSISPACVSLRRKEGGNELDRGIV